MEVLDHFVLSLNVFFDAIKVVRNTTKVLLLKPVRVFLFLFSNRENVLDGVGHNEIFVRFQSMHGSFVGLRNSILFVLAVIGEISDFIGRLIPGGRVSFPIVPVCFFIKLFGEGFLSPFTCPKVLDSPYSVCAWSPTANSPPRLAP